MENTLTVSGNILGTGSHSGAGEILMNGSGKTISGATLGKLELSNAGGFSLTGSATISTLVFTNGKLALGAFDLTCSNDHGCNIFKIYRYRCCRCFKKIMSCSYYS
jgi:hypothetical protein